MHDAPFNRSATYDPDTLKALGETFESAWGYVAHNFGGLSREPARLELASIILEFAANGDCNLLELKCRAIGAMKVPRAA